MRLTDSMATSIDSDPTLDAELVQQARQGCLDAFEQIVHRHHTAIRRYLTHRLGDLAAADDVTQEVFISAMKQVGRLDNPSSLKSWLFSIARHRAIDYYRKRSRRRDRSLDSLQELVDQRSLARLHSDSPTDSVDLVQALDHCLSKLSASARSLIDEFYYQGASAEVIGQRRNQRAGTVRMALLRVRKSLAKCIGKATG